jgi:hypothetical protein
MPGSRFGAAMVGKADVAHLGLRLVVLDHKVHFVPLRSRAKAGYPPALSVSVAIRPYAAALSLGSVVEYLEDRGPRR